MPAVAAAIVSVFVAVGGAVVTFVTSIFSSNLLLLGLSIGLSYLSSLLFRPPQPKPEDVQTIVKSPASARQRHYGRVKTSGVLVFIDSVRGILDKVIAIGTGRMDAFEEFWIDDRHVTVPRNGGLWETEVSHFDARGAIFWRLGLPTETYYSQLEAFYDEWTSDHRGDGIASIYAYFKPGHPKYFSQEWPNGANVQVRVVARGALIYNPVSEQIAWGDNAADIIADYMQHQDGMRLPAAMFTTPLATAGWIVAHNRCAEQITTKGGGAIDRYRLWGTYMFDERPADVLGRMLVCCDGRIVPTSDGGVTLDIGAWEEPDVTLDADTITGFSELSRGRDIITIANIITSTYTSGIHDFQATDADPWRDEDNIALRGEVIKDQPFNMSPSHAQTRRLMKLEAYRANPSWLGTFQCNLKGLAAFGKRLVRITYPAFDLDEVFEIVDFRFNIGEGQILSGVTLQVQAMPAASYAWDAELEEGTEPVSESTTVDRTIPVPTGLHFAYERIAVEDIRLPIGIINANTPYEGLRLEGRYKKSSEADVNWQIVVFGEEATSAKTGVLEDGSQYEAQVRHMTLTGRSSEWSGSDTVTPTADATAPGQVTGVSAVGGTGDTVALSWTNPNSANFSGVHIYRNTVNTQGTATLVRTEYGPPSAADGWLDTGMDAGSYWYWLASFNGSGVEAAAVATGEVVVI